MELCHHGTHSERHPPPPCMLERSNHHLPQCLREERGREEERKGGERKGGEREGGEREGGREEGGEEIGIEIIEGRREGGKKVE